MTTPCKNIAVVIADLGSGGAQKIASGVMEHWAAQGHHVRCITLDDGAHDFFRLSPAIKRCALNQKAPSGNLIQALLANRNRIACLRKALEEQQPDVVVSFIAPTNILCVLAARGLGARVIISERNDPARQSFGRVWDALRKRFYKRADLVTANSEAALQALQAYVPENKLVFIANHLQKPDAFYIRPREDKNNIVLAVGRLHPQKRFDLLIDAFARVHAVYPDWRLVIAGHGGLEQILKAQCKDRGIEEHVEFPGLVENPYDYYARAKIFALPSRHEGTPNALLEAMSCGVVPVISSTIEGGRSFVEEGKNGFVFQSGCSESLGEALVRSIQLCQDEPDLYEVYAKRCREVVSVLDEKTIFARWDDIL